MEENETAVKLENHERRIVSAEHRIKDLEEESKSTHDLAMSVQRLAISMENMLQEQKDQGERLRKLENEPAERWNSAKKTAFTSIVSTVAGALAVGLIMLLAQYL